MHTTQKFIYKTRQNELEVSNLMPGLTFTLIESSCNEDKDIILYVNLYKRNKNKTASMCFTGICTVDTSTAVKFA